ncbi:MAG: sodium:solute symporter family protein [Acidobacteria bacterium]|nr:MAG: sodium:solute symporter family protein [Acidobacteriota bacterium]
MSLMAWSWIFLVLYAGGMIAFGWIASRRVRSADDFATARRGYGPLVLALAFAASTASGATFLGSPGLSYSYGMASVWGAFLYPMGVYLGVLLAIKLVSSSGHRFGNRSIPEYLGDRYQSDGIRLLVSIFSLVLFFYIAGQLVSGLVMFEIMLGLEPIWALIITTIVLVVYVVLGGAHADILTDSVQGFLMLLVAALTIVLVVVGFGVEGGFGGVVDSLRSQDENLVGALNPATPLYHSWWSILAILLAHTPLGMLPHIGNKVWALRDDRDRSRFVWMAFGVGLTLGLLGIGGLLSRAILGDALLQPGRTPNEALPALFIELFPTWFAALIGVGILSAIMSTADGLVVSSSQIIANDIYRRSIVPRLKRKMTGSEVDRQVLIISRWSTVIVLLACMGLAWSTMNMNVALLVWVGSGGMMAAFAGPLMLGALWRGVTARGAYAGLVLGMGTFVLLHSGIVWRIFDPAGLGPLSGVAVWLQGEQTNPYSCAAMGELVSVAATYVVSKLTQPLSAQHLADVFGDPAQAGAE